MDILFCNEAFEIGNRIFTSDQLDMVVLRVKVKLSFANPNGAHHEILKVSHLLSSYCAERLHKLRFDPVLIAFRRVRNVWPIKILVLGFRVITLGYSIFNV